MLISLEPIQFVVICFCCGREMINSHPNKSGYQQRFCGESLLVQQKNLKAYNVTLWMFDISVFIVILQI